MSATQALGRENQEGLTTRQITVSVELLAYVGLALLALVVRVAQLDAVPLTTYEARQALAAWRVVQPGMAGAPIVPESPLLFALHSLLFTVLGASELTVRIATVFGSIGLLLSPLLFRSLLGRTRTFIFSLLLAFSPALLVAGRTDSPIVWTMLAAVMGLWGVWRYWQSAQRYYAVIATVSFAAMFFLTDPTGPFFALVLLGAALGVFWLRGRDASSSDAEDIETPDPAFALMRERMNEWPWQTGLLVSGLSIFLVGTLFMLYPPGLSSVGELLGAGVRGLAVAQPYTPAAFPLLVTLFYEPVLVILGIGAIVWMVSQQRYTAVDQFFTGWLVFGAVFCLLYDGARAEQALWLLLPLAGLTSSLVTDFVARSEGLIWWSSPSWSRGLIALLMVALLGMFTIHAQSLARSLMNMPDGSLQFGMTNSISVVWVIIIILFVIIGYFLTASLWGAGTATRGGLLGLLAFTLVTGLGSGWHIAVENADNPVEFWNRQASSSEMFALRQMMVELSKRNTSGFPQIPVYVVGADAGLIAWTLRDFPNTHFVLDIGAAKTQEIVLLPQTVDKPDLGGDYVGTRFVASSIWDYHTVRLVDFPAWWLQRRTRTGGVPSEAVILWLRQDIYNGVPFPVGQS